MADNRHPPTQHVASPVLVGREQELALLTHGVHQSMAGQGGLVLVSGEAGIGKTALIQQLTASASEQGALVLKGAAYDLTTTPPYGPWLDLLRTYPASDELPPVPEFVSSQEAVSVPGTRDEFHEAMLAFFRRVANARPLVMVLEDLHWADPPSLEFLRELARGIGNDRITLIASWRAEEITRRHPLYQLLPVLIRESNAERVELRALVEKDLCELIRHQFPMSDVDEQALAEHLMAEAEGNPLFTVELLRTLIRERVIQCEDGLWQVGQLPRRTVPSLIRQLVERRLADLSDVTVSALQHGSVLGQQFTLERWEQVVDGDIMRAAEEALELHLLEEDDAGREVAFRHALVRESIYRTISLPRRRELHRSVAETYLQDALPDPENVAWHLQQAHDPRAAEWLVSAAEQAERRYAWQIALERHEEAARILRERGDQDLLLSRVLLRMGRLLRFSNQNRAMGYLQESQQVSLRNGDEVTAAFALFNIGAYQPTPGSEQDRVRKLLDAIEILSNTDQDIESIGKWAVTRVASEIDPFRTICATGVLQLAWAGRLTRALDLARQLLPENWEAETVEVPEFTEQYPYLSNFDAYGGCGMIFSRTGQLDKAEAAYKLTWETAKRLNYRPGLVLQCNDHLYDHHFPYRTSDLAQRSELLDLIAREAPATFESLGEGTATFGLDWCYLMDGRWDQLRIRIRENVTPTTYHLWYLSMLARARFWLYVGDYERVKEVLIQLLPGGPDEKPEDYAHPIPGEPHRIAALLALEEHDLERARDWMSAHDDWLRFTGALRGKADGMLIWGEIHLAEGDLEEARRFAERAGQLASDPEQPISLLGIHRFFGQLDSADDRFEEADLWLAKSLELAEKCALPFERARTMFALAEMYLRLGQQDKSRELLKEVTSVCARLGARPTLQRARELLSRPSPRRAEDVFGLTRRELEVLRLLAEGMTDREIAEQLFISPHTVMRHVSGILRKLDVDSRTAAASRAIRENLA